MLTPQKFCANVDSVLQESHPLGSTQSVSSTNGIFYKQEQKDGLGKSLAGFGLVYPKKLIAVLLLLNSSTTWSSQTQLEKPLSSFHAKPVQCCAC